MKNCKVLVVLLAVFCLGSGLDLPDDFKTCKRSDENLNECLKSAIQSALVKVEKGLPALKIAPVQPVKIEKLTIGEGKGTVHVVQNFKDVNIYDIVKARIEKVNATVLPNGFILEIDAFLSKIKVEGLYDFNGRILVLPIVGTGKATVLFDDIKAHLVVIGETFEKKGETYAEAKTFTVKLNPEKINFNFENLFNGDERLGKEMNNLLNDNWRDVWEDVKVGYEDSIALVLQNIANSFFKNIPVNKLFPE